jgi:hypothetical protein
MNDIINKFNNILKEKNIDINKVLGDEEQSEPLDFNFDLDTILKFKSIFNKLNDNNSPRNALLNSLRPYLRENRQKKLNQYIKIANLLGIIAILNEDSDEKK